MFETAFSYVMTSISIQKFMFFCWLTATVNPSDLSYSHEIKHILCQFTCYCSIFCCPDR